MVKNSKLSPWSIKNHRSTAMAMNVRDEVFFFHQRTFQTNVTKTTSNSIISQIVCRLILN